jgi:hypothetical protein
LKESKFRAPRLLCYAFLFIVANKHVLDEVNMKASDVMSVDIISGTENLSAVEVATRIEYGG